MSQENVETVGASIEAYAAGDVDLCLEFMADDVEIYPDPSFPETTPFRGREEYRHFLGEIEQSWEGRAGIVVREIFPVGDRIVARTDWGGRGRASGIDSWSNLTLICAVRDGQIIKIEFFFDHAAALEAAGRQE
jgi:ketosteroid isomerase-like protein